jgi:methionyl-tRNA formyltransferase
MTGVWILISENTDIRKVITLNKPRYVFFPFWSKIVNENILSITECVCFHMTDLPYGRGGTPLQNLIIRGFSETKLTAIRMIKELDAGPIYLKKELNLIGSAGEIYERASQIIFDMIAEIVELEPAPTPQVGDVVNFRRLTPEKSEIDGIENLEKLHDKIRMLDADGYPRAFIKYQNWYLEFYSAMNTGDYIEAKVNIFNRSKKYE